MTRILVHVHLYYFDMWPELKQAVQNITAPYDLFVTVTEHNADIEKDILAFNSEARIILVENKGFDVWPFIKVLNDVDLNDYDYIVKLHSKRDMPIGTLRNGFDVSRDMWRKYLYAFLSNTTNFEKCLKAFEADKTLGMISDYRMIVKNEKKYPELVKKVTVTLNSLGFKANKHSSYVMGTMFMVQAKLFEPLKRLQLTEKNFTTSKHSGKDELPYVFELLFGYLTEAQSYQIKDVLTSPTKQIYGKIFSILKNFLWRKKVTSSGKIVCKFCKIPVFVSKNKGGNNVV